MLPLLLQSCMGIQPLRCSQMTERNPSLIISFWIGHLLPYSLPPKRVLSVLAQILDSYGILTIWAWLAPSLARQAVTIQLSNRHRKCGPWVISRIGQKCSDNVFPSKNSSVSKWKCSMAPGGLSQSLDFQAAREVGTGIFPNIPYQFFQNGII